MSNVIGDYESGNGKVRLGKWEWGLGMGIGEWESGNGDWGMRKKWGMRMWFFLPPKIHGNGKWGLGNGFQNGECIRAYFRKEKY